MPFKFWKNKKLQSIAISLIVILAIALIFSNLDFERRIRTPTYPFEASIWEKFLASVSQVFEIGPAKRIEVDLSQQKVKISEGKRIISEFSVSTGSAGTPTPTGRFRVYNKSVIVYSKVAKCWMPFWVGFTTDGLYGFHELPICEEGRKGLEELGKPASIGCIRLGIEDSETFYRWVEIGTPVMIYGRYSPPPPEPASIQNKKSVWCHNFNINLTFGNASDEIIALQTALTEEKVYRGPIDNYFGIDVLRAVIAFQEKYVSEILSPWGLTKGTGFVGPTTRNKLNQLYGCQ